MTPLLLITRDRDLIAAIDATGTPYETVETTDDARELAGDWPLVLVGLDLTGDLDPAAIGADALALVVTGEPPAPVWRRAVELRAAHVLSLPDAGPWLAAQVAGTGLFN